MVKVVHSDAFSDIELRSMVDTVRSCEVDRYGGATYSNTTVMGAGAWS